MRRTLRLCLLVLVSIAGLVAGRLLAGRWAGPHLLAEARQRFEAKYGPLRPELATERIPESTNAALLLEEAATRLSIDRADRELLGGAIEEMLRWVSPVIHMRRTASADAEIGGHPVRAGEKVVLWYTSANRDDAVFADPDRFDIARAPNEHLAFGGGGVHYCLGANLARVEIRAIFEQLLTRVAIVEPTGAVERLPSLFINGPRHMPVRLTAAGTR